jgi:DNA-binding NarL/FixJ family response regulator
MGHRSRPEQAPVPARRPRVLIAEPHDGFRRALGAYLEAQFEIVAVVASEVALDECARAGLPDVVVCDLSLLSSVRRWARRERHPPEIGIVGLALHEAPDLAGRLRRRGLAACVPKWAAASELTPAIHLALAAGRT